MEKAHQSQSPQPRGVTAEDGSSLARFERAALELFTTTSVDSTTTKQIAAKAGLSEGLLYHYAKSKNELAQNMFFAIHSRLGVLVRQAGQEGKTLDEKAANIVQSYLQCGDDDWTLFSYHILTTHRFLGNNLSTDNPVTATEDILRAAIEAKEIPQTNVVLLAAMVLGIVLQPALHKAHGRIDTPLCAHKKTITAAVQRILHPSTIQLFTEM